METYQRKHFKNKQPFLDRFCSNIIGNLAKWNRNVSHPINFGKEIEINYDCRKMAVGFIKLKYAKFEVVLQLIRYFMYCYIDEINRNMSIGKNIYLINTANCN